MSISVNAFSSQLSELQQDEDEFKKQLDGQQKLNKEKTKLKRALSKAANALKGGEKKEHKAENAQMAYVQAMNTMMNDNLSAMGANAEHMQMLNAPMTDYNNQLAELSRESNQLNSNNSMDSQNMMEKMQELNIRFSALNTNIGNLGTEASQDSMQIKTLATENNAQAGNAAQTIDFVHRSERTKHL